jgi:ABC-type molybdate transport system substrate-binding protein
MSALTYAWISITKNLFGEVSQMKRMITVILFFAFFIAYPQFGFAKDMLLVYSGAGMRKPMDEIGPLFEQKYGVAVKYNYAGSNTLLSQIELTKRGDCYMPGATMHINKAWKRDLSITKNP